MNRFANFRLRGEFGVLARVRHAARPRCQPRTDQRKKDCTDKRQCACTDQR
jgi:hypothetical protein